jgi:hypothetical protein
VIQAIFESIEPLRHERIPAIDVFDRRVLNFVGSFLRSFSNPFWRSDTAREAVFVILGADRRVLSKAFCESFLVPSLDPACEVAVVAVLALLNNLIDVVRPGVRVHIRTANLETVDGVVERLVVGQVTVGDKEFVLRSVLEVWAVPREVDLSMIEDFTPFVRLFEEADFKQEHLNRLQAGVNQFVSEGSAVCRAPCLR